MVKNLQPGPLWTPGTVTYKAVIFSIRIHDGQVWKHHINYFKALDDQNTQVFPIEPDESGSEFMNTPSEIFSESTTQQLTVPSSSDTESNTTQAAAVATSPTSSTSHYPTRDAHEVSSRASAYVRHAGGPRGAGVRN